MARILKSVSAAGPLLSNGYALVANAGLSSVLGLVFWMVATRLYSQDQVGLAAALISSMTTISYLSQMNLSSFLTRFIPFSRAGARRLIVRSYAAAAIVSAVAATVFALWVGFFAEPLQVIRSNPATMVIFVTATVVWTLFALQDAALSGLRRSVIVPIENVAYSLLKIFALLAFAMLILPAPGGIFLAWTLPLVPVVVVINFMIFQGLPKGIPETPVSGPDLRTVTRFLGWDFFGSLALTAALGLAPLMITASAGLPSTATYHLAWSLSYSVYLIGRAMSVSLVAEGATHPHRLRRLIVDTLSHTLFWVFGVVAVMFVAAPLIMGLFGQTYVGEGTPILRVLVLSCLPWAVTTVFCAAARVRGQTRSVAAVQVSTVAVLVAVSAAIIEKNGALGVALGWLSAHTLVCIGVVFTVIRREGSGAVIDWSLALAASTSRLVKGMVSLLYGNKKGVDIDAERLLAEIEHPAVSGLTPAALTGSLSDVNAVLLKSEGTVPEKVKAVLKYAQTERGVSSLQRNANVLKKLATDERLDPYFKLLPEVLVEARVREGYCTVETAVSGIDGLQILRDAERVKLAVAAVNLVLADMHKRTSETQVLDDDWAVQWIDRPINVAISSNGPFGKQKKRAVIFDSLRRELRHVFVGREMALGLGHGDISPANLFFSEAVGSGDKVEVTGIIDWETSRLDALVALDACHMGLTFQMELSGEELGPVVRDFLEHRRWSDEQQSIFGATGFNCEFGQTSDQRLGRAIVLLTWLHHVATILSKSDRGSNNLLWTTVNVNRVLPMIALTSSEAFN